MIEDTPILKNGALDSLLLDQMLADLEYSIS